MNKPNREYAIEYTVDNYYDDCGYITNLHSMLDVNRAISKLKKLYGKRIVKLDYKLFEENELVKHVTVI